MLFFETYKEFVDNDNRKNRSNTPITAETLTYKHEAMAPTFLIDGKTVLDLGSCIGATGQWCLFNGAKKYTGIEFQQEYVDLSKKLLSNHWSSEKFSIIKNDIENFLFTNKEKYDIVFACGVIYGFLNVQEILKLICLSANECIIIDTLFPHEMLHARSSVIEILSIQHMIKSGSDSSYVGAGARPSPVALSRLMKNLGFVNKENLIYPKKLSNNNIHDVYHDLIDRQTGIKTPSRFIMRFYNDGAKINSVSESLLDNTNIDEHPLLPSLLK